MTAAELIERYGVERAGALHAFAVYAAGTTAVAKASDLPRDTT